MTWGVYAKWTIEGVSLAAVVFSLLAAYRIGRGRIGVPQHRRKPTILILIGASIATGTLAYAILPAPSVQLSLLFWLYLSGILTWALGAFWLTRVT